MIGAPTVAALESELRRVQMLVGDLQRQRNELSAQVRQLTEKSKTLCQQIRPSPTGIAGAGPVPAKKRATSGWIETDLDSDVVQDLAVDRSSTTVSPNMSQMSIPFYINADDKKNSKCLREKQEQCKERYVIVVLVLSQRQIIRRAVRWIIVRDVEAQRTAILLRCRRIASRSIVNRWISASLTTE